MNNEKRVDYRFDEKTGRSIVTLNGAFDSLQFDENNNMIIDDPDVTYTTHPPAGKRATAPKPAPAPQPEAVNKSLSDVAMALLLGFLAGTIAVGLATLAFIFL